MELRSLSGSVVSVVPVVACVIGLRGVDPGGFEGVDGPQADGPPSLAELTSWFDGPNGELILDWTDTRLEVTPEDVAAAEEHVRRVVAAAGIEFDPERVFIPYLDDRPDRDLLRETVELAWPYWRRTVEFLHPEAGRCVYTDLRDRLGRARTHLVEGNVTYDARAADASPQAGASGATFEIWRLRELFRLLTSDALEERWRDAPNGSSTLSAPWEAIGGDLTFDSKVALFPSGFWRYQGSLRCELTRREQGGAAVRLDWLDPLGVSLATDEVRTDPSGAPILMRRTAWLLGGGPAIHVSERRGVARRVGRVEVEALAWEPRPDSGSTVGEGRRDGGPATSRARVAAGVEGDLRLYPVGAGPRGDETSETAGAGLDSSGPFLVPVTGLGTIAVELEPARMERRELEFLIDPVFDPEARLVRVEPTCECGRLRIATESDRGPWIVRLVQTRAAAYDRFAAFDLVFEQPDGGEVGRRVELVPSTGTVPGASLFAFVGVCTEIDAALEVAVPLDASSFWSGLAGAVLPVMGDLQGEVRIEQRENAGRCFLVGQLTVRDARAFGALEGIARVETDAGGRLELHLLAERHPGDAVSTATFRRLRPQSGRRVEESFEVRLRGPDGAGTEDASAPTRVEGAPGFVRAVTVEPRDGGRLEVSIDWTRTGGEPCQSIAVGEILHGRDRIRLHLLDPSCRP